MANAVDENKDQEFKDDLDAFNQQQRLEEERRAEEEASQQQNQNQNIQVIKILSLPYILYSLQELS